MDKEIEKNLVYRSRDGSKSAYSRLVDAYSGRVFAICVGMLGHTEDAADAAQQVFLKCFTQISRLRDAERFGPWIMRIARNVCTDSIRRKSRQSEIVVQPQRTEPDEPDKYLTLRKALEKLPGEYRTVLMLYYFDGQTANSVAQTLGINEPVVYARLSRARKKLRSLLEMHGDML